MMFKPRSLLFLLLLGSSCTAFAQVYQSTDEEGNTSFSDTPSEGSTEIKIPETNVGDSVEVPPPDPEPTPAPAPDVTVKESPPTEAVEENYSNGGGNYRRRHHRRYGHGR